MSDELHCLCFVAERPMAEHMPDCLVGAVLTVARALTALGNNDAATSMGAIEALGAVVRDGLADITNAMMGER